MLVYTTFGGWYLPPAAHKQLFLKEGVVDAALDALRQSSMAHVQFKALGILRLLADKQGGWITGRRNRSSYNPWNV